MNRRKNLAFILAFALLCMALASCVPGDCSFTANEPLTAYRLPDGTSSLFGTVGAGDTYDVLAWTAEGWVGFDPGIAQAGNIGLARHRWVRLNATLSSSCLSSVDLVTLEDVEADMLASGQ